MVVSRSVVSGAAAGDPEAAAFRLAAIESLDQLATAEEVKELAIALVVAGILPQKAAEDALHIVIATVRGKIRSSKK